LKIVGQILAQLEQYGVQFDFGGRHGSKALNHTIGIDHYILADENLTGKKRGAGTSPLSPLSIAWRESRGVR
jgi:hypothetical protein